MCTFPNCLLFLTCDMQSGCDDDLGIEALAGNQIYLRERRFGSRSADAHFLRPVGRTAPRNTEPRRNRIPMGQGASGQVGREPVLPNLKSKPVRALT
jgi:hypothetical protein